MNVSRIFVQAFARRVAYVLVAAALAWFGFGGSARASDHPSMAEAVAHLKSESIYQASYCGTAYPSLWATLDRHEITETEAPPTWAGIQLKTYCYRNLPPPGPMATPSVGGNHRYPLAQKCQLPEKFDLDSGTCKDPDKRCTDLNAGFANMGPQPRTWTSRCLANGCMAVLDNPVTTQVAGLGAVHRGTIRITGQCAAQPTEPVTDPEADKKDKQCTPAPDGQTFCVKANGDHCYSAGGNRMVCWKAGETGTKTDGDVAQKRTPGDQPQNPPTPPEGETLNPQTPTKTTTTGGTTNITTTTVNYVTGSGTNAGTKDQGEDSDGDGNVTGGADCGVAPVSTGDPTLAEVAKQAWHTRCGVEKANKVTGSTDCDAPPPQCTADQALCQIIQRERTNRCALNSEATTMAGESDGLEGITEGSVFGEPGGTTGGVSEGMFGGGVATCNFGPYYIGGQAVTLPPQFFTVAQWIAWLLVACAYLWMGQAIVGRG